MFPLLQKDGLVLAYLAVMLGYFALAVAPHFNATTSMEPSPGHTNAREPGTLMKLYVAMSIFGMLAIHLMEWTIPSPERYPHIFLYVFAIYSFGHFALTLIYCTYWQWTSDRVKHKEK